MTPKRMYNLGNPDAGTLDIQVLKFLNDVVVPAFMGPDPHIVDFDFNSSTDRVNLVNMFSEVLPDSGDVNVNNVLGYRLFIRDTAGYITLIPGIVVELIGVNRTSGGYFYMEFSGHYGDRDLYVSLDLDGDGYPPEELQFSIEARTLIRDITGSTEGFGIYPLNAVLIAPTFIFGQSTVEQIEIPETFIYITDSEFDIQSPNNFIPINAIAFRLEDTADITLIMSDSIEYSSTLELDDVGNGTRISNGVGLRSIDEWAQLMGEYDIDLNDWFEPESAESKGLQATKKNSIRAF